MGAFNVHPRRDAASRRRGRLWRHGRRCRSARARRRRRSPGVSRRAGLMGGGARGAFAGISRRSTDQRASAAYRALVARNLLFKALTEIASGGDARDAHRRPGARCRRPRSRAVDERVKSAAANPSPLAGEGREGGRGAGAQAWGLGRAVDAEINSACLSSTPSPPTPDPSPQGGGERGPSPRPPRRCRTIPPPSTCRARREYIDDIREPEGTLHVAVGQSPKARGRLAALDLGGVRAGPGVVAVLTAADIPGKNDVSPAFGDDPLFAVDEISFHGQALFAVVAPDPRRRAPRREARHRSRSRPSPRASPSRTRSRAAKRCCPTTPSAAATRRRRSRPRRTGSRARFASAARSISISRARSRSPSRARTAAMHVYSSTQHPTEVQHVVARVLGVPDAYVTCEIRRMGGGFGGKESQATQWAALAALAAHVTGRPCKIRLDRDDDFVLTGKRHDFRSDWRVGFDDDGPHRGLRSRAPRPLRLLGRPVAGRRRPDDVALRQRLLPARRRVSPRSGSRPTPSRTPPSAASAGRRACS